MLNTKAEEIKYLPVKEYLGLIEPYLADMINDYKSKGVWKIQLTVEINFTSLKPDSNETRIMHPKSDNTEIMTGSDTNEIIKELFKSFLQRYQEDLQEKMRGSEFEFDGVNLLYYDFNKISLYGGGSYLDSPNNGSTYDYHFIIKELVKEFDGKFECFGENTEKYITFSVLIKKEIKNKNKIIVIT